MQTAKTRRPRPPPPSPSPCPRSASVPPSLRSLPHLSASHHRSPRPPSAASGAVGGYSWCPHTRGGSFALGVSLLLSGVRLRSTVGGASLSTSPLLTPDSSTGRLPLTPHSTCPQRTAQAQDSHGNRSPLVEEWHEILPHHTPPRRVGCPALPRLPPPPFPSLPPLPLPLPPRAAARLPLQAQAVRLRLRVSAHRGGRQALVAGGLASHWSFGVSHCCLPVPAPPPFPAPSTAGGHRSLFIRPIQPYTCLTSFAQPTSMH